VGKAEGKEIAASPAPYVCCGTGQDCKGAAGTVGTIEIEEESSGARDEKAASEGASCCLVVLRAKTKESGRLLSLSFCDPDQ